MGKKGGNDRIAVANTIDWRREEDGIKAAYT